MRSFDRSWTCIQEYAHCKDNANESEVVTFQLDFETEPQNEVNIMQEHKSHHLSLYCGIVVHILKQVCTF